MQTATIPQDLRALAPIVALRLGVILAALAALVARGFLRNPRLVPLIIPLWSRLNRAARRFSQLMAHLAAGHLPRRRPGGGGSSTAKPPIPTGKAWLIHALRHDAANYASQLAHLLAEPGVAELLAAAPAAQRILNPIRHALGLPTVGRRPAPARPKPPPAAPAPPPEASALLPWPPVELCPRLLNRWPFRPFVPHTVIPNPA